MDILSENDLKKYEAEIKNGDKRFKNLELQVLQMEINNIIEERVKNSPVSTKSPRRNSPIAGNSKSNPKKMSNNS
jgi:hypothetical protein